jgi:cytoplasmic iron level regulating protein YaaA (DUF328/UPF0246 family)
MGISAKLADLNFERFLKWNIDHQAENSKPSIFAYMGDVYDGIDTESLSLEKLKFINENVRILSGLYGVLKPFDLIQEYRLEMGTKLNIHNGKDLYKFWTNKITRTIIMAINESKGEKVLINLASNEYFKSIKLASLKCPVITPVFMEYKDNGYQIVSFYAKKARGMMTRFIAVENILNPEHIKMFNYGGYSFNQDLTTGNRWVFTR